MLKSIGEAVRTDSNNKLPSMSKHHKKAQDRVYVSRCHKGLFVGATGQRTHEQRETTDA